MKIQIKEKGGFHMTLFFPTAAVAGLIGSRTVAALFKKLLNDRRRAGETADHLLEQKEFKTWELSEDKIPRIAQKKLKKCLLQYRHLTLVEVTDADGDYVKIVL